MKKKILLFLSVLLLWGCQSVQEKTLKQHVTLSFFYLSTCSECKAFKKNAIPYIEKTFGDSITIHQYDLDADETKPIYDHVIDSLDNFDEEMYGYGPFISIDGYFAQMGYTNGDEKYLVSDIEKAVNDEELGYELEGLRFLYKES